MIMGPRRGIFQDPRGCTSRKKRSMSTENDHKTRSYSHPIRGGMYGCFFPMTTVPNSPISQGSSCVGGEGLRVAALT